MTTKLANIQYSDLANSNATLVKYVVPKEGQTFVYQPQSQLDAMSYPLSERNGGGAYVVPIQEEKLYLNFIPNKTVISDISLNNYLETVFTYFIPVEIIPPDPFSLPDGTIFRCVSQDSVPEPKESYVYWIIEEGKKKVIPNYKTLEVMLFERNQNLLSVRIVQENQCMEIEENGAVPDKTSSWNEDYKDQTNFELLKGLESSVKSGAAIANDAKAAAGEQIAAVKAEAEANKAAAEAAKAEAEAAKAASEQAIVEAQAQIAAIQAQQNNS
jgi:hypothetical protein